MRAAEPETPPASAKFCGAEFVQAQLAAAQTALEGLVGLEEVKGEIAKLITIARNMRQAAKPFPNMGLHTIFVGKSGTAKSHLACILARSSWPPASPEICEPKYVTASESA